MKKLMTMIGAVAMAFGLYATDPVPFLGGTAFEANEPSENPETSYQDGVLSTDWWTIPADAEKYAVIEGKSDKTETQRAKYFVDAGWSNNGILDLKTKQGSPIGHKIVTGDNPYVVGDYGVYFDGLVNFTLFDYGDTVPVPADAKIAVYPQLQAEADTVAKLVIKAADEDGAKEFVTAKDIADGEWHRITIKTIANVYTTGESVGFVVFLDGNMVSATNALEITEANLTSNAKNFNKLDGLFLSLKGNEDEFTGVAFDGTGKLDEIMFTEVAPFEGAEDTKYFTVNGLANVASFDYAADGGDSEAAKIVDGMAELDLGKGAVEKIYLTNIKYAEGYCGPATKDIDVTDDMSYNFASDVKDAAASFNGVGYENLTGAVNAANTAEEDGTLKLLTDVTATIKIENENAKTITLDLGGQNVTVDGKAIRTYSEVVITNSVAGGVVTGTVYNEDGDNDTVLTIMAGTFDSAVAAGDSDGGIVIWDGRFLASANADLAEYAIIMPTGKTLIPEEGDTGYLVVGDPIVTTWTATVAGPTTGVMLQSITTNDVPVVTPAAAGNYTINADDSVVVTYAPAEGYEFAPDSAASVQTLEDADDKRASVSPTAQLKTFTVTYKVEGKEDATEQVNWGESPKSVPTPASKTGYTGEWDKNPNGAVIKANETFTYTYKANTYTITYKYGNQTLSLEPASYTYGVGATLPATVDEQILGAALEGWYDNEGLTGTAVTTIGTEETENKTFWAKKVSVTPAGEVEKKVDGEVIGTGKTVIDAIVTATGSDQTKVDAYVTKVYGEKIPAADVNKADPALVPASMYYGLPLMSEEPTVTVVPATADEGAAAFTFTVNVNGKPAELAKAEAQKMVKYTTKLGDDKTPFHESTSTEVTITAKNDGTMKAEFTAGEATAGFMKVDVSMPEVE